MFRLNWSNSTCLRIGLQSKRLFDVFDKKIQMKRVDGGRIKTELLVKAFRLCIFRVNKNGAASNNFGGINDP